MPRTERLECRVEPALADALDRPRGLATRLRWIEQAIVEKLATNGDELLGSTTASVRTPEREWPRRPPPRHHGRRNVP